MNTTELIKATGWGAAIGGVAGWILSTPIAGLTSLATGVAALSSHKFCNDPAGPALDNTGKVVKRTFVGVQFAGGLSGAVLGAFTVCAVKVAIYFHAKIKAK